MKKTVVSFITISCLYLSSFADNNIYSGTFIKSLIDKVNNYQNTHPWKENDDNWIRGTYYTGVMAVYQATGDKNYLLQCNSWGDRLGWQIPTLKPGESASGANLLTSGQTWLESYMIKNETYKIEPIVSYLDDPTVRNALSEPLEWYFENGRRYVDGLFTGPPALAMLYRITGKEKYVNWLDAFFWDVYGTLYDMEEGLFYRDNRFIQGYSGDIDAKYLIPEIIPYEEARRTYVYQQTKNGNKVIWSRGNGWAFAGLVRILKYLPDYSANYERYKAVFVRMAEELKKCQQPNGFWYPNLADPKDYGSPESSGTGFFVYGLAWGINNGVLTSEEYLPIVKSGWTALVSAVNDEGKVQWGQLVGAAPYKVLQEDSHEYVSGTFLLAASEIYQMKF